MLFQEPKIKIYGLPRSGTNFLEFMVTNSFGFVPLINHYGWKHGSLNQTINYNHLIIFKNIYSWLVSLHSFVRINQKRKFENYFPQYKKSTFSQFIREKLYWDTKHKCDLFDKAENPIQLWNFILKDCLEKECVKEKTFIYYEDFLFDTENKVKIIAKKFNLKIKKIIYPKGDVGYNGSKCRRKSDKVVYKKYDKYKEKYYMNYYEKSDIGFVEKYFPSDLFKKLMDVAI